MVTNAVPTEGPIAELISEVRSALQPVWGSHFPILRHATRRENLPSILSRGLDPSFYGAIHGSMELHASVPCVYLATGERSGNLHTSLFEKGAEEVVLLDIDPSKLDLSLFYPDDALYVLWAQEEIFQDAEDTAAELQIDDKLAERYFTMLEAASDKELPNLMQPLWRWYLEREGEVAYAGVVPPSAIIGFRPYGRDADSEVEVRPWRN